MARIRHIALVAKDPEELANFYKTAFGMTEVHRHFIEDSKEKFTIYLSDGHINLAIFPPSQINKRPEGIYHFGFEVEDVDRAYQTAIDAGAKPPWRVTPRDGRFAETFVLDPVGQKVDLARGWQTSVNENATTRS